MADTEKSEPQTNGLENGLDEDERTKMRPADIDADVKEMERRKRVEMIMSSKLFREELERIIELQLKDGNGPAGLLQQISDMMGIQSGKLHATHMFRGSNCVTPINDIRGVESMGYEKGEKNLRCKLASVFRLMDLYGWSQGINNQITARLNQDEEHFLVNPHGMLFNEITASSLVKVDMQGNVVEPGTTNFSVNTQGFLLHSAIHASRPDVNCVIHIKTPSVLAVSSLKCGLLPVCQEALVIGEVSQHPFVSGIFEPEEREKIIRNLGPHNKVLLLHNHGAVCCGATVEEAFYNVYNTVLACETQMKLMPMGVENLLLVNDETRKQVYDAAHRGPDSTAAAGDKKKQFRVGEMEFEALIRMLDNAGFRTGYIYRHPLVKGELPKPKNDVEVPPAVSSLGYLIEQEELYKQGNWKKYIDGKNRLDRTKWLNSPNVYQKVEILETGTPDPKKITKWVDQNSEEWVAESSPTHSSTPVKIDSALQFVPKGTNPKEFKKLQQQIKENRRADKITSGPQSHILEGVSWEEAKKLQDANITQTGDQVILVGAASKGIIQRNYQHNALVYKTPYAKNPFDSMSDKEIEDYKQLVERKQRGDTDYEESQSESEAISSSRQDALRHIRSPLLSPQSATSETEEESRDEPRVLRIETKTAPRPIQAEVVLSDADSDTTDTRVERSHSARYPKAEKPESVTLMNSFRKSWSLKREKDKSKDVETNSRYFDVYKDEQDSMEFPQYCIARIKQLTHKPVFVNISTKKTRPLLKSASDPCNLSSVEYEPEERNHPADLSKEANNSLSCSSVNVSDLKHRLKIRKKMLHSAKMKFFEHHKSTEEENDLKKNASSSPMCALISEIRETINEIMSPERVTIQDDHYDSLRWIERPKFIPSGQEVSEIKSKVSLSDCFNDITIEPESRIEQNMESDVETDKSDINCSCAFHRNVTEYPESEEDLKQKVIVDENQNEKLPENVITEVVKFVNASDDEATYTITDDSLLPTYSFTESTETEWYYNKTIMTLDNSQTVLEIKEVESKEGENAENPVKYIDTGIDTEFSSEKEIEIRPNEKQKEVEITPNEEQREEEVDTTVDLGNAQFGDTGLNKSSETDSSFLKTSSGGQTSNDIDTSVAFKTETESSEKSPAKRLELNESMGERQIFLEEMLQKAKEPIEEESSEAESRHKDDVEKSPSCKDSEAAKILESPEFTNIDTEDAPITSSSKDTSPEVPNSTMIFTEDEPFVADKPEVDKKKEKQEQKRKKNVKTSTEITVKKEMKNKNSAEAKVSEIKLTINNSNKSQIQKFEVNIQEVTNTSGESSSSAEETFENFLVVEESCDCDAKRSLEELQNEVTNSIGKLQTIENYFEDEIKKHSDSSPESKQNGPDELTIDYNYQEFEDILNEATGKSLIEKNQTPNEEVNFVFSVLDNSTDSQDMAENMDNFSVSSAFIAAMLTEAVLEKVPSEKLNLGATEGEELKDENVTVSLFVDFVEQENNCDTNGTNFATNMETEKNTPEETPQIDIDMSLNPVGNDIEQLGLQNDPEKKEICNSNDEPEVIFLGVLDPVESDEYLEPQNELQDKDESVIPTAETENLTIQSEVTFADGTCLQPGVENEVLNSLNELKEEVNVEPETMILRPETLNNEPEIVVLDSEAQNVESETVIATSEPLNVDPEAVMPENADNEPEVGISNLDPPISKLETDNVSQSNSGLESGEPVERLDKKDEEFPKCETNDEQLNDGNEIETKNEVEYPEEEQIPKTDVEIITKYESGLIESVQFLFSCSFKALILEPYTTQELISNEAENENVESVKYVINCILNSVFKDNGKLPSVNDVINFIVTNGESPADSLAEFEDYETMVSSTNTILVENQLDLESLPDDDEALPTSRKKKKKDDAIFKVTIATPNMKEIYTNYSPDFSCSFNISEELNGQLCNSYIKTDDVNDDLENLSSDNPDFFSVGSPEKNSLNNSFCSADSHTISEPCTCLDLDDNAKSPRSLGIIMEVDECDSSNNSTPE